VTNSVKVCNQCQRIQSESEALTCYHCYGPLRVLESRPRNARDLAQRFYRHPWVQASAMVIAASAVAIFLVVQIWQEATRPERPRAPWRPCDEIFTDSLEIYQCEQDERYGSLEEPEPDYRGRP